MNRRQRNEKKRNEKAHRYISPLSTWVHQVHFICQTWGRWWCNQCDWRSAAFILLVVGPLAPHGEHTHSQDRDSEEQNLISHSIEKNDIQGRCDWFWTGSWPNVDWSHKTEFRGLLIHFLSLSFHSPSLNPSLSIFLTVGHQCSSHLGCTTPE